MSEPFVHEAYEELIGDADAPAVLSCEHASPRLPEPWSWHPDDHWLMGTHWAYDLGARAFTLELGAALRANAVLARFSRLLVDPNRSLDQESLFRTICDERVVRLNEAMSEEDKQARLERYYKPFHSALDQALARSTAPLLFSIHSFTPNYEGVIRDVEIGVLFNDEEEHALPLFDALRASFANVALNEPWSGKSGLIYSAESHAHAFGRIPLELEVRQDRLEDPAFRARLVPVVRDFIAQRFGISAR